MTCAKNADVAELADAPDLGSGVPDVQVQVLLSAPVGNPIEFRFCGVCCLLGTHFKFDNIKSIFIGDVV